MGSKIPQSDCLICSACSQGSAIRAERNAVHGACVTDEGFAYELPSGDIPEIDAFVQTARSQDLAIPAEGYGVDRQGCLTCESELSGVKAPKVDVIVPRPSRYHGAIRAKCKD